MVGFSAKSAAIGFLCACVMLLVFSAIPIGHNSNDSNNSIETRLNNTREVFDCINEFTTPDMKKNSDMEQKTKIADMCYRIMHGSGLLGDFKIRRIKFIQQQYDELVMLWMVVAITVSGVFLAGLQLAGSYRLALINGSKFGDQSHEITVEQSRLVFKSSITGLAILVISFAFFLVFVLEVYVIKEIKPDAGVMPAGAQTSIVTSGQSQGGYGPGNSSQSPEKKP